MTNHGSRGAPAEDLAAELLWSLCQDILDIQIGTRMFWGTDQKLREDPFAEYIHHWLQKASKDMGWEHHDSSAAWG
jgi:hypothetical protein